MGLERISLKLCSKKHWRKINEQLWLDRVWEEAHLENETVFILRDNIAAGQRTLELDRKWRESITKIGLDAFTEKLNENPEVRSG